MIRHPAGSRVTQERKDMKRRYLVAALLESGISYQYVNSIVDLEHDERMNATAIQQMQELLKKQQGADTAVIISIAPLEGPEPRYALHDELRNDWMSANTYCTDNGIEGPGNAIRLLIEDHKLATAQREHWKGLYFMLRHALEGVAKADSLEDARECADLVVKHAENIRRQLRTTSQADRHPMTPNSIEYGQPLQKNRDYVHTVGIDSEGGSHD